MVDCTGLENRRPARVREFESHRFRQARSTSIIAAPSTGDFDCMCEGRHAEAYSGYLIDLPEHADRKAQAIEQLRRCGLLDSLVFTGSANGKGLSPEEIARLFDARKN